MEQKEQIIKNYQRKEIVKTFDKSRGEHSFLKYKHKIESHFLLKALNSFNKSLKILDVACGTGRMLPIVFESKNKIDYTGLDTSKEMVKILKKRAVKINQKPKIVIASALKMPFKDESFDLVYTYHLLWHIPKKDQIKVIKEILRVTKKNGLIIFDVLNANFLWNKIKKILRIKNIPGIYKFTVKEIVDLLNSKKYEIEKLFDVPIKNNLLYKITNIVNLTRKILPINLYHMLFFKIKK